MTTAVASLSAMAAAGLLAFGLTTPLGAVATGAGDGTASALSSASTASAGEVTASGEDEEIQAFVAGDDAAAPELDRVDDYSAASFADLAEASGINTAGAFFTNDPTADIQWPFAVGTGMSYGYGMRSGRLHEGIDFTPGSGAPVQSIADGTVRIATESGGAYGVNVYIDHVIDGQTITSHYAHMQYGSLRVTAGQKVEVGDVIGLVGRHGSLVRSARALRAAVGRFDVRSAAVASRSTPARTSPRRTRNPATRTSISRATTPE